MSAAAPLDAAADFWSAAAALARAPERATRIGETPADIVLRLGKTTLARYRPATHPAPGPALLIVHGRVGRASIADLAPDRSLARDLLGRGADVWTIDWGRPSRADRHRGFADHVTGDLADCAAHVAAETGRAPALLGICEGGVFALCLAALEPAAASGLALAITPVDFHAAPEALLARWIRAIPPRELERLVDVFGYLPGGLMGATFQAMTPGRGMETYTTGLLDLAQDAAALRRFLRMERWLMDRPHHPGAAAKELLIGLYHENRLVRGRFELDGRRVDPRAVRAPVLVALGLRDHIVPPACARGLAPLLAPGLPYEEHAFEAGHIGVFVSRRVSGRLSAALAGWLARLG